MKNEDNETYFYTKLHQEDLKGVDAGFFAVSTQSASWFFLVLVWLWAWLEPPLWILGMTLLITTALTVFFGEIKNPQQENPSRATSFEAALSVGEIHTTLKLRSPRKVWRALVFGRSVSKYSLLLQTPIFFGVSWAFVSGNMAALTAPNVVGSMIFLKVYSEWLAKRIYLNDFFQWTIIPWLSKKRWRKINNTLGLKPKDIVPGTLIILLGIYYLSL